MGTKTHHTINIAVALFAIIIWCDNRFSDNRILDSKIFKANFINEWVPFIEIWVPFDERGCGYYDLRYPHHILSDDYYCLPNNWELGVHLVPNPEYLTTITPDLFWSLSIPERRSILKTLLKNQ